MAEQITGIILAAGASQRMGKSKWQTHICGKSFLDHIIDTFKAANINQIYAVFRAESFPPESNYISLINPDPNRGQLSSLKTALYKIPSDSPFMMQLVDRPLVKTSTLNHIIEVFEGEQIVIPSFYGRKGHPVLFPPRMREILLNSNDDIGIKGGIERWEKGVKLINVDDERILWNIDTEEELRRIEKTL